jgi:succinate dehydrogenase/fumarate reductase flavoprotein subunit/uncharacterized protein with FMN-binding domain
MAENRASVAGDHMFMQEEFMKVKLGVLWPVVMVISILALGFTACSNPTSGGDGRTRVTDGTYVTTGIGKSVTTPITVTTTFVNNTLVDISIGENQETAPILDSVKTLLIPRILESQSIGVDSISGATLSSAGVKQAIAEAIDGNGGESSEWYQAPRRSSTKVTLTGYDVIVVGLGGAGMTAYVKASEAGAKVYGIEVAGKIGGNSATTGGPMAINSQYIKDLYNGGADYADRDALLKQWYIDMEAVVPNDEMAMLAGKTHANDDPAYPIPPQGPTTAPYSGGPKWEMIKQLIDESGETVSWLAEDYSFHFARPSGLAYPQYNTIVTNYGSEQWSPGTGGYTVDGNGGYKTTMFTRAIETAKARNPLSNYKLELRATELIMTTDGKVAGVKAAYRDGTSYEIYGKAVILATGGYIGNPEMTRQYLGTALSGEAVHTDRGDGIRMGLAAGAAPYNISMPAMVHIAQVKNIIQTDELTANQKAVLSALLLRGDGLVVGLHDMSVRYGANLAGKRFSNEASMMIGGIAFENWRVGGHFASIISNDVLNSIKTAGMPFAPFVMFLAQGTYTANAAVPDLDTILSVGKAKGNVVEAATLEDLAAELTKLGDPISGTTLRATVEQYNKFVDKTEPDTEYDKSNVLGFGGPPVDYFTTKVTEDSPTAGGYTAILGAGYYYGTCGGLDIDDDMQVLNTGKQKIPGLYAVGQDSMGVLFNHRKAYVGYGAAAQGWAITSGRLAGANAAAAALAP